MPPEDLRTTVERVGERFTLGEYEIEAYLTVLEHGQLTASEVADRTDIPQPRVYDTVRSLRDRGLVELRESRPMKVIAIDPADAFDDVQHSLEELVDALGARYTAPPQETEAVALVKSRSTIIRHLEEVIESAVFELALSVTPDLLTRFQDDLQAALERDVSVDLIVTPADEAPAPDAFDYEQVATEVRARRGITTPVIAVADGNYSIYATQDALRGDRDRYGVTFNHSALGFLVTGFYGTVLWTTAEEVVSREGTERDFPRRYASIRRCVKDLVGESGDLYASIAGRDVTVGGPRVVDGRVVDVSYSTSEEVASLSLETDEGPVSIGGRVAALEDIEAHEIRIGREAPPGLEEGR